MAASNVSRNAVVLISGLLVAFVALAWVAASRESPTADETDHAVAALAYDRTGDFRMNPEHPPLWKYWAGLAVRSGPFRADFDAPAWKRMPAYIPAEWDWAVDTLYRSGNDADALVGRERAMMLVWGTALAVVTAAWAWQTAGPVAAVVAAGLFCLDPNFLAHSPLVTNDVGVALMWAATLWALWRAGRRATWVNLLAAAVLAAAAICTKSVGLLAIPAAVILLVARALLPAPWVFLGRTLPTIRARLAAAGAVVVGSAALVVLLIWACYGFRFAPSPEPAVRFDLAPLLVTARETGLLAAHPDRRPTPEERAAWTPGTSVRAILWAERHRLLPQAYLVGVLFNYTNGRVQDDFLCGNYSRTGWWYYFPLAMLFKTPTATLGAMVGAIVLGARRISPSPGTPGEGRGEGDFEGRTTVDERNHPHPNPLPAYRERVPFAWTSLCLAVPVVIYAAAAMTTAMNIGVRHVLPVYPLIYIAIGIAAAKLWDARPRAARWTFGILGIALLAETLLAFPNYISFFNTPSGGARGGLRLLSDSNIDWGQDLKRLAAWQQAHPTERLYLSYFGTADPSYYGIRYMNLLGGYTRGTQAPQWLSAPGTIAVSATNLQGTYYGDISQLREFYAVLRGIEPKEVLGGSIYLYDYPLRGNPNSTAPR